MVLISEVAEADPIVADPLSQSEPADVASSGEAAPASFAKTAPEALGAFNVGRERLEQVERNGWRTVGFLMKPQYTGSGDPSAWKVEEDLDFESVRLLRRPLDGFTLQASRFHEFEVAHPSYFPFRYRYPRKQGGAESCYREVLNLAVKEFGELDFLQPLASIIQVARGDVFAPMITRCWDFGKRPAALIKTASMEWAGGERRIEGSCICYQPPTRAHLEKHPEDYLKFRSVVAHEIGHQWWNGIRSNRPVALRDVDDSDRGQLEQVVSLFSVFLILYRGYWHRDRHDRAQLERAFDKLRFESDWAKENRETILDDVVALEFPSRTFDPGRLPEPEVAPEPETRLGELAVLEIRKAARRIAEKARPIPFASSAAILGQRKLDYFIGFELGEADDDPVWTVHEIEAAHVDPDVPDVRSEWRHVRLSVPAPERDRSELNLKKSLEVARQIANLRLFGGRYGEGPEALWRPEDVERECSALDRDLARVLALGLYAHEGRKSFRKLDPAVARLLLHQSSPSLGYLDEDFDYYFQWCCVDPDCPEAEDRFLAEIHEVGRDEVHFTLESEDSRRFRGSLATARFREAGFSEGDLRPGTEFTLFGREGDLYPVRYPDPTP